MNLSYQLWFIRSIYLEVYEKGSEVEYKSIQENVAVIINTYQKGKRKKCVAAAPWAEE